MALHIGHKLCVSMQYRTISVIGSRQRATCKASKKLLKAQPIRFMRVQVREELAMKSL